MAKKFYNFALDNVGSPVFELLCCASTSDAVLAISFPDKFDHPGTGRFPPRSATFQQRRSEAGAPGREAPKLAGSRPVSPTGKPGDV